MIMLSLIFSVPAGYYIFVPELLRSKYYYRNLESSGISDILPYAASAAFIFILMDSQRKISNFLGLSPSLNYDRYMLMLEGTKVSVFQSLANPMLTYFCGVVYLVGFPFLLIFTFILFLFSQDDKALKEYAITFILIYLIAYVFYIFFPVNVTGHVLPGVIPLLYQLNPAIMGIVTICSPRLNNCFPSLHAALSVMATMFILFKTDLRRYKVFAVGTTIFILFSILYLGIHWITDMIGGIILALSSYFVATRIFKKRFKNESTHFYMR
ncbi:phosphatase PAP2 family protein [Methanosarcina sp.]|nr:phosphatase PAP2 family protein [Methanosarcina sp.]MDW5558818.1 phosphatase PAP2 family protein [Methanosarcina sp.]